ncbi:hypothetical protein OUZ56_018895, partial [Daphnia magna]
MVLISISYGAAVDCYSKYAKRKETHIHICLDFQMKEINFRLCGLHFDINNFLVTPTKRRSELNWNAELPDIQNQPHPPSITDEAYNKDMKIDRQFKFMEL